MYDSRIKHKNKRGSRALSLQAFKERIQWWWDLTEAIHTPKRKSSSQKYVFDVTNDYTLMKGIYEKMQKQMRIFPNTEERRMIKAIKLKFNLPVNYWIKKLLSFLKNEFTTTTTNRL